MHPMLVEQMARLRMEQLHREAEARRRLRAAPGYAGRSVRLLLAAHALRLARALDRDARVVPAHTGH